jgi:hypothetical protein
VGVEVQEASNPLSAANGAWERVPTGLGSSAPARYGTDMFLSGLVELPRLMEEVTAGLPTQLWCQYGVTFSLSLF